MTNVEGKTKRVRPPANMTQPKGRMMPEPSMPVRIARIFYTVLSSVFVEGVLLQLFFAGLGAFGADWSWHITFVHFLEPLPLLMVPFAFVGRLSWGLRLLPFGLLVLIGVQYALDSVAVPAAALHPLIGFLILLSSLLIARRAWSAAFGRKVG